MGSYQSGEKTGNWIEKAEDHVKSDGIYMNGIKNGYWIEENDSRDGKATGKIKGNYKNGVIDGLREEYYTTGEIKSRIEYKNGRYNGNYEFYNNIHFDENIKRIGQYENDKQIGIWKKIKEDDNLILMEEYENDELIKSWYQSKEESVEEK
jgi:antitoxin component YwqK of YwqJK toxin-antitoxin module